MRPQVSSIGLMGAPRKVSYAPSPVRFAARPLLEHLEGDGDCKAIRITPRFDQAWCWSSERNSRMLLTFRGQGGFRAARLLRMPAKSD